MPELGQRYRVVALDHRGHGRGVRTDRFRLEDAADDVVALADVLGIERFVAVGYSMGGPIAQLVWKRHRDRVSGLVLSATSYQFRDAPLKRALFASAPLLERGANSIPNAVSQAVVGEIASRVLARLPIPQWARDELLTVDPRSVLQATNALGAYTARDWIGAIDVPTSVLVHSHDRLVPTRHQLDLAAAIPEARVHCVDGDHFVAARHPHRFVPQLLSALHHVTTARRIDALRRSSPSHNRHSSKTRSTAPPARLRSGGSARLPRTTAVTR
jgi:3-oxoadipate enol-lactonase